jgi:hypothetical protein
MPQVTLSTENTTVERNIRPPVALCITLPVHLDGKRSDVAVYVTTSPFARTAERTDSVALRAIAVAITNAVNGLVASDSDDYKRYLREFPRHDPRD